MQLRVATAEDIPEIVRLVNNAYRSEGGWTGESHLIAGPRTGAEDVSDMIRKPGGDVLTVWEPDRLVGCVYVNKEGDKLYLGMLSVRTSMQGAGIGKELMLAATDYAKLHHCHVIRITVISVRAELIAWYERRGFRRTGEMEPFHHGDRFGTQKQALELAVLEKIVE